MSMLHRHKSAVLVSVLMAVVGAVVIASALAKAQARTDGIPRLANGQVNLSGIWQANNTAHWDILTHQARQGPLVALGAAFSIPGGLGVVEGNEIPYKPEALARKKQNADNWLTADPEIKCYSPGVP